MVFDTRAPKLLPYDCTSSTIERRLYENDFKSNIWKMCPHVPSFSLKLKTNSRHIYSNFFSSFINTTFRLTQISKQIYICYNQFQYTIRATHEAISNTKLPTNSPCQTTDGRLYGKHLCLAGGLSVASFASSIILNARKSKLRSVQPILQLSHQCGKSTQGLEHRRNNIRNAILAECRVSRWWWPLWNNQRLQKERSLYAFQPQTYT